MVLESILKQQGITVTGGLAVQAFVIVMAMVAACAAKSALE